MKGTHLSAIFVLTLLILLAVGGGQSVAFVEANPFIYDGDVLPDSSTKPPRIEIFSPENNTAYAAASFLFSINVSLPESPRAYNTYIDLIYYMVDWQQNKTILYETKPGNLDDKIESRRSDSKYWYFQNSQSLEDVPDGTHNITLCIISGGSYIVPSNSGQPHYNNFIIESESTVFLTIDTKPPSIKNLSIENETYTSTEIPLSITINEEISQLSYSLDNQANITLLGNTTLSGLTEGAHQIVIFANDTVGNIGASDIILFTIDPKPSASLTFPTQQPILEPTQTVIPTPTLSPSTKNTMFPFTSTLSVVVAFATAAIAIAGFVIYLRKNKKTKSTR